MHVCLIGFQSIGVNVRIQFVAIPTRRDCGAYGEFSRRYMFCQRPFERLKKYHSRGIEIINPPNGALALAEDPWNMCMDDFG